ncbi:MAG: hypothetical protein H6818_13890 [Phycisphaerales bacterium]|nr:hypothetical protein [Phycisphaerales bacterium]MCB9862106.1 hypothetical protein [Phycisphaerales bacterium]
MHEPTHQQNQPPETLDYAPAPRVEDPHAPMAFKRLFLGSLAALAISMIAGPSGIGPPQSGVTVIAACLGIASVVVLNILALWSFALLRLGYWKNTFIGFAAVIAGAVAIVGDIAIIVVFN